MERGRVERNAFENQRTREKKKVKKVYKMKSENVDKNYLIVGCIDEMIKLKLIDENNDEFKVKGFNWKKRYLTDKDKDKICFWTETDNSEIRIKKLKESEFNEFKN